MSKNISSAIGALDKHPNPGMQLVEVRLFCAEHCRICNEAKSLVSRIGVVIQCINILDDDSLFEKYRLRIPVLQRVDNNAELDGPFDTLAVSRFLMAPV